MNRNKDILKSYLRKRLENYEYPVQRDLWSELEREIPGSKPFPLKIYLAIASVAVIFLVMWLSYPLFLNVTQPDTDLSFSQPIEENQEKEKEIIEPETPISSEQLTIAIIPVHKTKQTVKYTLPSSDSTIIVEEDTISKTSMEEQVKEEQKEAKWEYKDNQDTHYHTYETKQPVNKSSSSDLLFSIAANGTLFNDNPDISDIINSSRLSTYANQFNIGSILNQQHPSEDKLTSIKYKTPVTFSLLVRKNLTQRWAIETGLSYTYLSSEETWESIEYMDKSINHIKLHYVGLPIKGSYSFINNGRFVLYFSAGGMIEKLISNKATSTSQITGVSISSDLDINKWQFSLNGNLGSSYQLFKPVSLFVEPGVAYYFDNGSDVMTIRKDKPFNFNIQGGLRWNF